MKEKIINGEWFIGIKIFLQCYLVVSFFVNRSMVVIVIENLIVEGLFSGNKGGGIKVINNMWSLLVLGFYMNWNLYVEVGIY